MIQETTQSFSQMLRQQNYPTEITVLSILEPQAKRNKNNTVLNELKLFAENMFSKAKKIISPLISNSNSVQIKNKTQNQEEKIFKVETFQQISQQNKQKLKTKKIQKTTRGKGCSFVEWSQRQEQKINQSFIRKRISQKKHNRSQNSLLNISKIDNYHKNNKSKLNKTILNISEIYSEFSDYLQKNNQINLDKSTLTLQEQNTNGPQLLQYPNFNRQKIIEVTDNFQKVIQKFDKYKRDHCEVQNTKSNLNQTIIRKKPKLESQLNKNSIKIYQKLIAQIQPVTQKKNQSLSESFFNFKYSDRKHDQAIQNQIRQHANDFPSKQVIEQNPLISRRKLYNFKISQQNKFDVSKSFRNMCNLHKEEMQKEKLRRQIQMDEQLRKLKQKQKQQFNKQKQEEEKIKELEIKKHLQFQQRKQTSNLQGQLKQITDQQKQAPQKGQQNLLNLKQQKNKQSKEENKPSSFGQVLAQNKDSSQGNDNNQNQKVYIKQISKLEYKVSVTQSTFPNIASTQVSAPQSPKVTINSQLRQNNPFLNPPSNKKILLMDQIMKKSPEVGQKIQGFNFASPTKNPSNNSLFQSPQKKSGLFDTIKNPSQFSTPIFNKNASSQLPNQLDSSMCDQVSQSNVPAIDNSFVQNSLSNSFSGGNIFPTSNILSNSGSNLFSNANNSFSKNIPSSFNNSLPQDNLNMFSANTNQFNPPNINKNQALSLFMTKTNPNPNDSFSLFGNPPTSMQPKKSDRQRRKKGAKQERIS